MNFERYRDTDSVAVTCRYVCCRRGLSGFKAMHGVGVVHFCSDMFGRYEGENIMTQVIHGLPSNIMMDMVTDPALMYMVERCLEEPELIEQFTRLYGVGLPRMAKSPAEHMVDVATGWRDDQYRQFFNAFIPFVHRAVYLPMKTQFENNGA